MSTRTTRFGVDHPTVVPRERDEPRDRGADRDDDPSA